MFSKIVLSLALIVMLGTNACTSVTPTVEQINVISLREHYPLLLAEAQQWKKDAYLADVGIDSKGRGGGISALFGSMSDKDESLYVAVSVDSNHLTSELLKGEVPLIYQTPILEEDWKIDSAEAMALFLTEEDIRELWLEFPERCSELSLRYFWANNQFVLAWILTISDCLGLKHTYYFFLDPITGERLELSY
jgi:hypothetical protein